MKSLIVSAPFALCLALLAACQNPSQTPAPAPSAAAAGPAASSSSAVKLESENDKTVYTLGFMLGRNVGVFNLSPAELELVKTGLYDSVGGKKPAVDPQAYQQRIQGLARTRAEARAEGEKAKSKVFLDAAAKEPGATKTESGLVIRTLRPGTGATPTKADTVKVHYVGTLTDGTEFDSSIKRGTPAEFPVTGVVPCWTEALQRMKVGEKARLVCPSAIAYGDQGRPPQIPGGATLIFEVELLEIVHQAPPDAGSAAPEAGPPRPDLRLQSH